MSKGKIAGIASGISVAVLAPLASFAAAPTTFSTTTAVAVLDEVWDGLVAFFTGMAPILVPVVLALAAISITWRFLKRRFLM